MFHREKDETESEGVEVRAPMEKMRSGLDTEPSSTGSSFITVDEEKNDKKLEKDKWTRREVFFAMFGIMALIGLVVGLVVALAPRANQTDSVPRTTATNDSPFPETKESIDSVCLNGDNYNRTACRDACEPATCCASIFERDSCVSQYPEACLAHTSCHAVWDNTTSTAPLDLHTTCSWENKSACREACQEAACCWEDNASCVADNLIKCLDYAPCQVFIKQESSLYPTDTSQLLQVCGTDENDDTCHDQCQQASCCWEEDQGNEDDCFQTDLIACLTYAPCPQFHKLPRPYSRVDPPGVDLRDICSVDSILTSEGFQACDETCQEASCCTAAREPYNCFHEDPLGCLQYHACLLLDQAGGSVPRAPDSIQTRCRDYQTLDINDFQWCMDTCQHGACCFANDNCAEDGNQLACEEYSVCQPLLQATQTGTTRLPRPPAQLKVCTAANLQTEAGWNMCASICQPAACCNSLGDDNCLLDNISTCSEWNEGGCYVFANTIGRSDAVFVKRSDYVGN